MSNSKKREDLTASRLQEFLKYNSSTGEFIRISSKSKNSIVGKVAGSKNRSDGYIYIIVDGFRYLAHRLVWLYVTGEWPANQIDHKDGDRTNNKFSNLRDVTNQVNGQNRRKASVNNKSTGLLGVYPNRKRFMARIRANKRYLHLGTFDTSIEAHFAYVDAKRKLHEGCEI